MKNIKKSFPFTIVVTVLLATAFFHITAFAVQTNIIGPVGSRQFGTQVAALPNGNIVITDPFYNAPGPVNAVGAVYLFNGSTGALISVLSGSTANDNVGRGGVTVLANGNYVVSSPNWINGNIAFAGASTLCNGETGCSGTVSATNSLVGTTASDRVSSSGIIPLTNGNYIVHSASWDGVAQDVGAVTFGNGTTGITGIVTASNSLVGSTMEDQIGGFGITTLPNGNYLVSTLFWDGAAQDVGAVTFGNGTTGTTGSVSVSNSLVGSRAGDNVGIGGVKVLANGNYVVASTQWKGATNNVGAVTFGNGTTGITGTVSAVNSLVGSNLNDFVGSGGVAALTNGNYVVSSPSWDGTSISVGAATFCNGMTGTTGTINSANSLVGSTANDQIGFNGVTALTNSNYVVHSPLWDGKAANIGAATFGNGTIGITGTVSVANSLIGKIAEDRVGLGSTALTNGNYVVISSNWNNGTATNAGAVTFGNGTTGTTGTVSVFNSFVGSKMGDFVGATGVNALTNGNYVIRSGFWDEGTIQNVGAVTFAKGTSETIGTISESNSLIGSTEEDRVGSNNLVALRNGNYVVINANWDGAAPDVGAVTFGDGATGVAGRISASNSLVGSTAEDAVGEGGVVALSNGNYVVISPNWDNGTITDAGAVTYLSGFTGSNPLTQANENSNGEFPGNDLTITMSNSVVGTSMGKGILMGVSFDAANNQIVVGRPFENIVTLFGGLAPSTMGSIAGRVLTASGRGLPNAIVHLTKENGAVISRRSSSFGYYRFDDIEAGQTVVIGVNSKQNQFAPQVLQINNELTNLNFIAEEPPNRK